MPKQLTGSKIKNTSTFETYTVLSFDEKADEIHLYNHDTNESVRFVLSRVLKGLQTGKFSEVTK